MCVCVGVGVCVCVCVCVCVLIYVLCMHIQTDIHNGSLSLSGRDQYDNSYITHHNEPLWWKLLQPNKHHQFMPFEYLSFTYTRAFSYSFAVHTVCACYVHSPLLLVWVLIMLFDDDLIHLFQAGWDLGMQATEYKCNFPSYWVDLYTDA